MARLRSQQIPTTVISSSTTAPVTPSVGQRWFKPETAVTYQYTSDGATNFWLDISSGGIGQSALKSVDVVGDIDPHLEINPAGGVGSVYYNREANRFFICIDGTSNANVWSGRYAGFGGIQQTYDTGSNTYFISHTFLSSGVFHMDVTTSCQVLVVGGGGAGGQGISAGGGGGGAGDFNASTLSVTAGKYQVTVGQGGRKQGAVHAASPNKRGNNGESSVFSSVTAIGGGGGGTQSSEQNGAAGGSGGGGGYQGSGGTSSSFGNNGGNHNNAGGGGGGASTAGQTAPSSTQGGAGGNGTANAYRTGSNITYAAGGGGGGYADNSAGLGGSSNIGGKGGHSADGNPANDAAINTGSGGGGGGATTGHYEGGFAGNGSNGIVIIRYALNP